MNTNPLQQYFRRPAIYIKLPSQGKYYDNDVIIATESKEIPVYPMTSIDEITSRTPDAVFNGHAVADIIKSCIPSIIDPWKINSMDLHTILVAIRVASTGEEMDVDSKCPKCSAEHRYGVDLIELLSTLPYANYDNTLKINELEIKFRPLTYAETNKNGMDQYEIQKMLMMLDSVEDSPEKQKQIKDTVTHLNKLTTDIIAATISHIKTPETVVTDKAFIVEYLTNCDRKTNEAITTFSIELRNKNHLNPLHIKCQSCEHEYDQPFIINITDFFA